MFHKQGITLITYKSGWMIATKKKDDEYLGLESKVFVVLGIRLVKI